MNEEFFQQIVHDSFQFKRKTLRNNLKKYDLKDNGIYYYESEKNICNKNENIIITIKYNEYAKSNSLAYWYSASNDNPLKVNDIATDRKLSITTYGSKNEYTNLWFPVMFIFIDIMALIMEDNKDEEK